MAQLLTIPQSSLGFLEECSKLHARVMAERFSQEMYNQIIDNEISSPIEQMFYVAANLVCLAHGVLVNPEPVTIRGKDVLGFGVFISPQMKIGKYRVDFMIKQNEIGPNCAPVIVELDGHEFHDKDKKQRAYEKARDRFFVQNGYRVLHFTGSEVFADPIRVAQEALALVWVNEDGEYSESDPFGLGW